MNARLLTRQIRWHRKWKCGSYYPPILLATALVNRLSERERQIMVTELRRWM